MLFLFGSVKIWAAATVFVRFAICPCKVGGCYGNVCKKLQRFSFKLVRVGKHIALFFEVAKQYALALFCHVKFSGSFFAFNCVSMAEAEKMPKVAPFAKAVCAHPFFVGKAVCYTHSITTQ